MHLDSEDRVGARAGGVHQRRRDRSALVPLAEHLLQLVGILGHDLGEVLNVDAKDWMLFDLQTSSQLVPVGHWVQQVKNDLIVDFKICALYQETPRTSFLLLRDLLEKLLVHAWHYTSQDRIA